MKLSFYTPLDIRFGGGFERFLLNTLPNLSSHFDKINLICTNFTSGNEYRLEYSDVIKLLESTKIELNILPVHAIKLLSKRRYTFIGPDIRSAMNLVHDSDILYFNDAYFLQDIMAMMIKTASRIKVMAGMHAVLKQGSRPHDLYIDAISLPLLNHFDSIHVLNTSQESDFKDSISTKMFRIPEGTNTSFFSPGEKSEYFTVLFAGRLAYQKGVDRMVKVIVKMKNDFPEVFHKTQFRIIGSGEYEYLIKEIAAHYENVKYLGHVDDTKLRDEYRKASYFLMLSRYETFGIVGMEAMASGTPVISTNVDGVRDYLKPCENGWLIENSTIPSIVNAIIEAYRVYNNEYKIYERMAKQARITAISHDWKEISNLLFKAMKETIYS